ncbi:hypothetical protein [Nocardioides sp. Root140]|uniref:hypothetical protein n=1 Tax=Nocardioides sp. Root140 TaxID=1736460 RepID=UPI0006F8DC99|nr:hypothetical protein [Nocardioides sp. Root140]KQY56770.1 hypothetical protein ASD30_10690 [Nocardioides sp. Root140]
MVETEDLDAGGTLLFVEDALRLRRGSELDDLALGVRWAELHEEDPKTWPAARQFPGMAKLIPVGGAGTPMVQDLCLAELAISRQTHPMATRWLVADGLDLVHRLPKCWAVLKTLRCEAWVARRIARLTRHLNAEDAAYVDAAVAQALAGEQPSVVLEVCEAKIIEANPQLHEIRTREARERRFVSLGRMDAAGLRHVIARVENGDAVWVDAMLNRIADILAARDKEAEVPYRSLDTRRAEAFGWLARPAELLALLLEHAENPDPGPHSTDQDQPGDGHDEANDDDEDEAGNTDNDAAADDGGSDDQGQPSNSEPAGTSDAARDDNQTGADHEPEAASDAAAHPAPDPDAEPEPEDAEPGSSPVAWADGFPEHLLDALRQIDPVKLRPRAVVYVHLHQAALSTSHPTGRGTVAKVEDAGPMLPTNLAPMLGTALVQVTEVIDLNQTTPTATYVHPQWLKDRIQLLSPRTAFPHSTTVSRRVDYDHPVPYDHNPTAPPLKNTSRVVSHFGIKGWFPGSVVSGHGLTPRS